MLKAVYHPTLMGLDTQNLSESDNIYIYIDGGFKFILEWSSWAQYILLTFNNSLCGSCIVADENTILLW